MCITLKCCALCCTTVVCFTHLISFTHLITTNEHWVSRASLSVPNTLSSVRILMHSVPLVLTSLCSRYLGGWLLTSIHCWRCSQQALSSQAGWVELNTILSPVLLWCDDTRPTRQYFFVKTLFFLSVCSEAITTATTACRVDRYEGRHMKRSRRCLVVARDESRAFDLA